MKKREDAAIIEERLADAQMVEARKADERMAAERTVAVQKAEAQVADARIAEDRKSPLVTVIVPFYKTPFLLLRRCLDSILRQSFDDLELLAVDDGSGSDYDAIRREYEERDLRVHFLVKENGGVASARNYGIEHARGECLLFVDSDDYVDGFFVEGMWRAMQGTEAIPECEMALCAVAEMTFPMEDFLYNERMFFSLPSHFSGLQYINFSVNKMYRTRILQENNIRFPLDVKMGEDALFLAEYYKHCKLIRCVREAWYHYVLYHGSAMRAYKPEYWQWEKQVIRKDWELFHRYPLARREEMAMMHWLYAKMMGAANYYFDYEEDPAVLMQHFRDILEDEMIGKLLACDVSGDEDHFTQEEKKILAVIRKQGSKGLRKFVHKRIGE